MNDDANEPELSPLCQRISQGDLSVQVDIYRGDTGGWLLELVDEQNNSTVWEDEFDTEAEALAEAKAAIEEEGIEAFIGTPD